MDDDDAAATGDGAATCTAGGGGADCVGVGIVDTGVTGLGWWDGVGFATATGLATGG